MIRVFIVEDHPKQLMMLKAKVADLGYEVVGAFQDGQEARKHFQQAEADVVLMDINLDADQEGIGLARSLRELAETPIIFVTAMASDEVVEDAISASPSGYLMKPIQQAELKANIELAVKQNQRLTPKPIENAEYLTVRLGQKLQKVYFKDISYFQVESKNYVTLVDQQNRKFAVRGSIKKVLEQVLPGSFLRTHHSFGINLSYLEFIDESVQSIHLSTGQDIPIGKRFKKAVYDQINIT